jgi:cytidylate kinase
MSVSVVTLAVQEGSGGTEIARIVADRLGFIYLDREIILEAASVAGVSPDTLVTAERWPTFVERMLERLAKASALSEGVVPGGTPPGAAVLTMTSSDYRQIIERVVMELAKRGKCVIVGHAAQVILRQKIDGVYKVLVHGSERERAKRLAVELEVTAAEATKLIKEFDRSRHEFFKHVYNVDWQDSSLYNLTINTDEMAIGDAARLVLSGIEAVE